jgi:hypothetical protein
VFRDMASNETGDPGYQYPHDCHPFLGTNAPRPEQVSSMSR